MKHLRYFKESVSQEETIELIEDLFIMDIADKWVLSNNKSKSALENCWKVTKDYILYSEPPKNPITKLFIYIGKNKLRGKKLKLWDDDLDNFLSRLERFGYKIEKPRFWCADLRNQFYYHINITKSEI
jgi:hypothetical protein